MFASHPSRIKRALIVCDMQADAMPSLFAAAESTTPSTVSRGADGAANVATDPAARREAFVDAVKSVLRASLSSPPPEDDILVVFSGLRFPPRYAGLRGEHCLYGSLRRLNERAGDDRCHWFMESRPGSRINPELLDMVEKANENGGSGSAKHVVLWRTGHLPPAELSSALVENCITDATVVGARASQSVQATVQHIADNLPGIDLSVIKEALADDKQERLDSIVQHLLPLYSCVASLEEYIEATCGVERFAASFSKEEKEGGGAKSGKNNVQYFSNCERGGHFSLYTHHLIHRKAPPQKEGTSWMNYPTQKWYEDVFQGKQYYCPLGKRVVAFCDEPSFSNIAMFIKGRNCLDDKAKLMKLARDYLPETYVVEGGQAGWESAESPKAELEGGPWFVKETDKNGGRAVRIFADASACIAGANDPQQTYVVQRHVPNPHLTNDGRKWHLKLYTLLICEPKSEPSTGVTSSWTLRCHGDAFMCAASEKWSADDLTPGAQLTIERTKRFRNGRLMEEFNGADVYPDMFQRCSDTVASIVRQAVDLNELQGRPGKKQFETFSTDFMFDVTLQKSYVIEFNFSPVLFDPHANQELTTPGLRKYKTLFDHHGENAEVNDHAMIKDAVSIVFFPKEVKNESRDNGHFGGWRVIQSFEV